MTGPPAATELSFAQFREVFADDDACVAHLIKMRWPGSFVCRRCKGRRGWRLAAPAATYECAGCGSQTSVKAGTLMHGSRLPLRVWFWAAHLVATSDEPVPVRQFQKILGINSYKAAFALRRTLLYLADEVEYYADELDSLQGVVEVNITQLDSTADHPLSNRYARTKLTLAAAIEVTDPDENASSPKGRIRLTTIADNSSKSIQAFVRTHIEPGSKLLIDRYTLYPNLTEYVLDPHEPAQPLRRTEWVFSCARSWLRNAKALDRVAVDKILETSLAEFAPETRQSDQGVTFESLLRLAMRLRHK